MSNRMFYPLRGSLNREVVTLFGSVTTSTGGAIASQSCKGFSVARTGTGVYAVTLQDAYAAVLDSRVTLSVAAITAGKGQLFVLTTNTPLSAALVLKVYRPDTQVVADVDDGAVLLFSISLSRVAV
jgi:hypothetical protein